MVGGRRGDFLCRGLRMRLLRTIKPGNDLWERGGRINHKWIGVGLGRCKWCDHLRGNRHPHCAAHPRENCRPHCCHGLLEFPQLRILSFQFPNSATTPFDSLHQPLTLVLQIGTYSCEACKINHLTRLKRVEGWLSSLVRFHWCGCACCLCLRAAACGRDRGCPACMAGGDTDNGLQRTGCLHCWVIDVHGKWIVIHAFEVIFIFVH